MKTPRHAVVEADLRNITALDLPWTDLEGKTVLVTGANGFLPAYLVESLLFLNETRFRKPIQVIALARNRERAEARFACYAGRPDLSFLVQDVSASLPQDLRADVILHAASQASPKYFSTDPVGTLNSNVLGTHQLLTLAKRTDARAFLFFSSSEIYGTMPPDHGPIREDHIGCVDPVQLRSSYAESKRLGETMCIAWHNQFGVPATIARIFHTYGPGMSLDDGRAFADFVADIVLDRPLRLTTRGTAVRTFTYLADTVGGLFTMLLRGQPGQAYNVGNEAAETTILGLAQTLSGLFPEKALPVTVPAADVHSGTVAVSRFCPDSGKLRALGWRPETSITEGFLRTIRSFS